MIAVSQPARCFLAAILVVAGLTTSTWAANTNPPPAAAAPAAATPTAAAVAAAGDILGDIGIKEKIALVVPGMMAELERNVTNTRPEIRDSLRQTLRAIQPEFDKTAQQIFDEAATLLASEMSEKELQEVAAFFASPAGKKYLAIEPVFLRKLGAVAEPWRQKLSTDILTRAREAMKKKGIEF